MKEEHRLAAIVATIDEEARIVPRGAFIKTPLNQVHTNRCFEGLIVTVFIRYMTVYHLTVSYISMMVENTKTHLCFLKF